VKGEAGMNMSTLARLAAVAILSAPWCLSYAQSAPPITVGNTTITPLTYFTKGAEYGYTNSTGTLLVAAWQDPSGSHLLAAQTVVDPASQLCTSDPAGVTQCVPTRYFYEVVMGDLADGDFSFDMGGAHLETDANRPGLSYTRYCYEFVDGAWTQAAACNMASKTAITGDWKVVRSAAPGSSNDTFVQPDFSEAYGSYSAVATATGSLLDNPKHTFGNVIGKPIYGLGPGVIFEGEGTGIGYSLGTSLFIAPDPGQNSVRPGVASPRVISPLRVPRTLTCGIPASGPSFTCGPPPYVR
jgi:hypothetical protein